jgi:putative ATPase
MKDLFSGSYSGGGKLGSGVGAGFGSAAGLGAPAPNSTFALNEHRAFSSLPLAVRMRPKSLKEVVGQEKILQKGSPLYRLIMQSDNAAPSSVIIFGPPGTGKTTIAYLIAQSTKRSFVELSAVSASVADIRRIVEAAKQDLLETGQETVLFIDEIHRFSKAQQDVLLPFIENRVVTLIAATTENPFFSIINPLLSRSILVELSELTQDNIKTLIKRALKDERGLSGDFSIDKDALEYISQVANNDARKALTVLEATAALHTGSGGARSGKVKSGEAKPQAAKSGGVGSQGAKSGTTKSGEASRKADGASATTHTPSTTTLPKITVSDIEKAIDKAFVRYDKTGDSHYDTISAFIKSVRGSDVDAAMHYLAKMISAGEDPRFIARRIIILASEDIGLADPMALQIAVSAAQAVQLIGMPEGRIILGEATAYLATAPKSNTSYMAIESALSDISSGKTGQVPAHLRDAHYKGAKKIKRGLDYKYAHDFPLHIAPQQYLPDEVREKTYFRPNNLGYEKIIAERLKEIDKILGKNR